MIGGVAGAAGAVQQDELEKQKVAAENLRAEMLAKLTLGNQQAMATFNQNLTNQNFDTVTAAEVRRQAALGPGAAANAGSMTTATETAKVEADKNRPITVPQGSRVVNPKTGTTIVDTEEHKLTALEQDLLAQRIDESMARADKYRADAAAKGTTGDKLQKNDMQNFKAVIGDDGKPNGTQFDDNTQISRKWVNGVDPVPAKPGSSLWFLKWGDKPAVAGTPGYYQYFDSKLQPVSADEVAKKYPKTEAAKEQSGAFVPGETEPTKKISTLKAAWASEKAALSDPEEQKNPNGIRVHTNNIAAIEDAIKRAGGTVPVATTSSPTAPPPGWVQIGTTPDGKAVYRTPEGRQKVL
jgi:hypothetical protein